jgi:hypothetical protein
VDLKVFLFTQFSVLFSENALVVSWHMHEKSEGVRTIDQRTILSVCF